MNVEESLADDGLHSLPMSTAASSSDTNVWLPSRDGTPRRVRLRVAGSYNEQCVICNGEATDYFCPTQVCSICGRTTQVVDNPHCSICAEHHTCIRRATAVAFQGHTSWFCNVNFECLEALAVHADRLLNIQPHTDVHPDQQTPWIAQLQLAQEDWRAFLMPYLRFRRL